MRATPLPVPFDRSSAPGAVEEMPTPDVALLSPSIRRAEDVR